MNYKQKKRIKIIKSGDKGSIWLLMISITVGYLLSFSVAATKFGRIYYWNTFFTLGLIIIVLGLLIRVISFRLLKQYFTYSVSKVENQELIEKGFYKVIRHPGYLGQILIFMGISIALSNWLSVIVMLFPILIGYMNRIRVEEKFMIEHMGDKYSDYQKRTKKLLPKIY
jgi:protein-S-isoprenylcysteine O-methyltransferase Ste14